MKPQIKFLDDCLLIDDSILVIGDLHVGYEEHVVSEGLLPKIQMKEVLGKLEGVFEGLDKKKIRLKKIILLGDLKHEFGSVSNSEWREVLQLLDYLLNKCKEIILIKGNHDNILGPIVRKRGIVLKNFYKIKNGKICFLHGHKLFKQCLNSQILVMGHLHPAVTIRDKYKKEKFKCFLYGNWKRKKVYILPSFSGISFGYDLGNLKYQKDEPGFCIVDVKALMKLNVLIYNEKEKRVLNFRGLKSWFEGCLKTRVEK